MANTKTKTIQVIGAIKSSVDTTLSKPGVAADAAVVGQALTEVKQSFEQAEQVLEGFGTSLEEQKQALTELEQQAGESLQQISQSIQENTEAIEQLQNNTDSGLPSVTSEDNGKFLRVVDGAWAAVAMLDVSEVGL